jgi:tripartite-type tricarboxylate transporter receptor subunit TctC
MKKTVTALLAAAVVACALAAGPAFAKWPEDKNITVVINWPAGVGIDLIGRLIVDGLNKKYPKATFIVENRAGAAGNIGQNYVAKAAPDGYTWLLTTPGSASNNVLTFKSLPYDPIKDFDGVSQMTSDTMGIIVNKKTSKLTSLAAFIDYAKANKGKLNIGHPGAGTYAHMILLALQDQLATEFNLVPYKGGADLGNDLMSGQIDALVNFTGSYSGQIASGDFQAIGVARDERSKFLPDVPTFKEGGVNFVAAPWTIMQAPKGVPREIINEMSKNVNDILNSKEVSDKILGMKVEPRPSTPEQVDALVRAELDKWRPVIAKYNIRVE